MSNKVEISPLAALKETTLLCEHYRNRNLVLAQRNLALEQQVLVLRERVQSLQNAARADGEADVAVEPVAASPEAGRAP